VPALRHGRKHTGDRFIAYDRFPSVKRISGLKEQTRRISAGANILYFSLNGRIFARPKKEKQDSVTGKSWQWSGGDSIPPRFQASKLKAGDAVSRFHGVEKTDCCCAFYVTMRQTGPVLLPHMAKVHLPGRSTRGTI
jgi:hypothetical protein